MQTRLPGIMFQTIQPKPPTNLPRMDIAGFVGLASSGPLNTPVRIDDITHYRDIFGDDLALVWDNEQQDMRSAYLGTAVESFFRNGGQRCWVVRVANSIITGRTAAYPQPHRWLLNQLVIPDTSQRIVQTVEINARSMGSWADNLKVDTVLRQRNLNPTSIEWDGNAQQFELILQLTDAPLIIGDLVQVTFVDNAYLVYIEVETESQENDVQTIHGQGFYAQYRDLDLTDPAITQIVKLNAAQPEVLFRDTGSILADGDDLIIQIELPADIDGSASTQLINNFFPTVGDLLRVTMPSIRGRFLYCPVSDVYIEADEAGIHSLFIRSSGWLLRSVRRGLLVSALRDQPSASCYTFALQVWQEQTLINQLDNLGFSRKHPRWWGQLLNDDTLFKHYDGREQPPELTLLQRESKQPRFALSAGGAPPFTIPLGMMFNGSADRAQLPITDHDPETRLIRDGVHEFNTRIFLDNRLTGLKVDNVLREANYRYYVQAEPNFPTGFYSLLPIDELSLIALPDAIHRPWVEVTSAIIPVLPTPDVSTPAVNDDNEIALIWQLRDGTSGSDENEITIKYARQLKIDGYDIQVSDEPLFTLPQAYFHRASNVYYFAMPDCGKRLYYRVRVVRGSEISAWSNTVTQIFPEPDFESQGEILINTPTLTATEAEGIWQLSWLPVTCTPATKVIDDLQYIIEFARTPSFFDAVTIHDGDVEAVEADISVDGDYFVRIRAYSTAENLTSAWSTTAIFQRADQQNMQLVSGLDYDNTDLLTLQEALIHYCAAHGTLLSVLGLPDHYRYVDAIRHTNSLKAKFAGLADTILSFAAMYYPWIVVRPDTPTEQTTALFTPPHGTIVGMIAARSISRGAWIAPANQELFGVLGFVPNLSRDNWEQLYRAQINTIQQDPRGFIVMSEHTLADSREYDLIHVRRLVMLLRRLAFREGQTLVFEPNSAVFRRLVQHRFQDVMSRLYALGAFAGSDPAQAFQVVTNALINTATSVDLGQVIVELKIAPAYPMAFITVRLLQKGERGLVVEEV